MPIRRTSDDIAASGPEWLSRLGRHLSALERGEEGAGHDLAAVLRTLLDKNNPGNRGMIRLAKALGTPLPTVIVSGGPDAGTQGSLVLSFGNLPVIPAPGDGLPHSPRSMSFEAWINALSIVAPSTEKRRQSWAEFVTLIANTDGSHLGTENHDLLVTSDMFDTVGLSLRDYLLRQIGWQVELVLAHLIVMTGRPILPRTRRLDLWPRMPIWMLLRQVHSGLEVAVSVNVSNDAISPVEVMRYPWRGKIHRIYHDGGDPRLGELRVRIVVEDPIAGTQTVADGDSHPSGWTPPGWGS